MEDFKKLPKMQHFKTGGSVGVTNKFKTGGLNNAFKKGGEVSHEDIVEDKKIVKKAIGIHDKQQHEEKTDLSKLKKGGRAKKDCGTVRKYKTGGVITGDKGPSGAKDAIKRVETKDKEVRVPSKAAAQPNAKGVAQPQKMCSGGKPKKMSDGSLTEKIMGTPKQNEASKKTLSQVAKQPGFIGSLERGAQKAANFLKGQGAVTDAERELANTAIAPSGAASEKEGSFNKKNGGKC